MAPFWTNPSVLRFAGDQDPEQVILERAQHLVFAAMEEGWTGPPYDPFELAEFLHIPVVAHEDLYDARVVPVGRGSNVRIEYNPSRPRARVRYSLAHELAHTLFPDVADAARYRSHPERARGDEWQLELLCNLAAAELLMPAGSFPGLHDEALDIEHLLDLRKRFEVSTEALLLRAARLTEEPIAVFACSRIEGNRPDARFRIEYLRGSRSWAPGARRGARLPRETALAAITAVGYTAGGEESWPGGLDAVRYEAVGLPRTRASACHESQG